MFRTQQNSFDEVVAKATDENLTSENWEYILDVCDRVQGTENGSKDVVAAMIKRLAHRNANVQLYTLELANALSQNCGIQLHRELASRSFTDALLRLAGDRTTHQQVKSKILERMEEWSRMFASNTELGFMDQAYQRLKSQNPNLQPPQAPRKQQITELDRQKEEEELQMALRLSIQDNKGASKPAAATAELSGQSVAVASSSTTPAAIPQSLPSGTTAATVSRVRALYDFVPSEPGELQFRKGDVIAVLESVYKDWWKGSLRGQTGIFPLNYIEKLSDPTESELQEEARTEAEVFGQIKNVERLLALLSTNGNDLNVRDNEEITQLYNATLAVRPKLIELIGKYTQKKDDLQQLNEKFIKARRDYEALLETSMTQAAHQYPVRPPSQFGYGPGAPQQPYPPHQRYHTQDGQPPYGGMPPQQQQQQQQQQHYAQQPLPEGFQPPYPSATPVPTSQTPGPHPVSTAGRPQSYHHEGPLHANGQYPPQSQSQPHPHQLPQELGSSAYEAPQRQQPYPPQDSKDYYSPSVYSHESGPPPADSHPYLPQGQHSSALPAPSTTTATAPYPGPSQQAPLQPQGTGPSYPPQPSYNAPPAPSHPAPSAPPDRIQATSPYQGYPPQIQSQAGGPGPQHTYQAYQPPPAQAAGGGVGGPASYYR